MKCMPPAVPIKPDDAPRDEPRDQARDEGASEGRGEDATAHVAEVLRALARSRRPIALAFAKLAQDLAKPALEEALADALFLAGIPPSQRANSVDARALRHLASAWERCLARDARLLRAADEPCPHCATPLREDRELVFCPRCQKHAEVPQVQEDPELPVLADSALRLGRVRFGCALWNYAPWSGELYPQGLAARDRLRAFAERFHCVEGNSFFYAMPAATTLQRWHDETPASFRFYPKFPKTISHEAPLTARVDDARRFLESLAPLAEKVAIVFLQLPPYVDARRLHEIERFFAELCPSAQSLEIELGCEVRHDELIEGPKADALDEALRALGVTRVMLDTRPIFGEGPDPQRDAPRPKPRLACVPRRTSASTVLRFVAHPELERNEAYFEEWSARLCEWLRDACDVTVFAHCPDERFSPAVAKALHHKMREILPQIPSLPWDHALDAPAQGQLFG